MHHRNRIAWVMGIILYSGIFFTGCSIQGQYTHDNPLSQNPKYTGMIIPISVPVSAEYRPVSMNTKSDGSIETLMFVDGKEKKEVSNTSTFSNTKISAIGDKLEWVTTIHKMVFANKTYESKIPIKEIREISNRYGLIEEMEISYPRLLQEGNKEIPSPGSDAYEQEKKEAKFGQRVLSSEPIITGSVLFRWDLSEMFRLIPEASTIIPNGEGKLEYIVKGWSYYKDRKVLVTEVAFNKSFQINYNNNEVAVSISLIGYSLFDAQTFALLEEEFILIFEGTVSGERGYFNKIAARNLSVIQ